MIDLVVNAWNKGDLATFTKIAGLIFMSSASLVILILACMCLVFLWKMLRE